MDADYPTIHLTEECMREGMQIESVDISVDDKLRLLDALSRTGLKRIVVGSFVRAAYTPQMADIDELLQRFEPRPGVTYLGLALNAKGRERMGAYPWLEAKRGVPSLSCHLCDVFVRRNANRSQQQEIDRWPAIVEQATANGASAAGIGVNAAFGSNFSGAFSLDQRMEALTRQHALWDEAGIPVTSVFVGDPMGWTTPQWVGEQLAAILATWPAITDFHIHLHDTRGLALASSYEAIRVLDSRHELHLDSTAGGIGGCPYCGNGRATGLAATEDLVNMLETMGIATGVDLDRLIDAVWLLEEILGRPSFGRVSKAGPHPGPDQLYDTNLPLIETFEEARHFKLGPAVAAHQLRPWRKPIPDAKDSIHA